MENTEKMKIMFGKYTDSKIAETLGVTRQYVSNYRIRLGIKPVGKWSMFVGLLGKTPDKEIAQKIGVTTGAVVRKRLRMGINPIGTQKERKFQQHFVSSLLEECEQYLKTEYGIIDVTTKNAIYELKPVLDISSLQKALGQLLLYKNAFPQKKLYIVSEKIKVSEGSIKTAQKLGITIITFVN